MKALEANEFAEKVAELFEYWRLRRVESWNWTNFVLLELILEFVSMEIQLK